MSAYGKICIGVALFLALGAGAWLYQRYAAIRTAAIEEKKAQTALYIQSRARSFIKPEDFTAGDRAAQRKIFESFFHDLQSPNLVRMKVWDRDFTVLWADLADLVGQRFPDNHEVEEAYEGKIEFEVEKPKTENVSERQYQELSEIYVPVSNSKGEVVGVIEVYQPTFSLNEKIQKSFRYQLLLTIGICLAVYLAFLVVLRLTVKKPPGSGGGP
jgi:hypothetical protein